jgi:UbiA prenyltransferase family.
MSSEVLFFQSLPQIDSDPLHGKKTLAFKLGKARALKIQSLSWPLIWFGCMLMTATGLTGWGSVGAISAFPAYLILQRRISSAASSGNFPALNSEGHLVKIMFVITSLALFAGLIFP